MYSKNDYRYYLEHGISISDNYLTHSELYHHGVLGMHWGVRRYQSYSTVPRKSGEGGKEIGSAKKKSKYESKNEKLTKKSTKLAAKRAKNSDKIQRYTEQLESPGMKRRAAKALSAQEKVDASNSSLITKRANARLKRGKDVGLIGNAALKKQADAERELAKASAPIDKLNTKIAELEYKNAKLDKKLAKIDTSIKINVEKDIRTTYRKNINEEARKQTKEYIKGKMSDSDYNKSMNRLGELQDYNQMLYNVEKAKIKGRSKNPGSFDAYYNDSYNDMKDILKREGSTAEDIIPINLDRKGRITTSRPIYNSGPLKEVNEPIKTARDSREQIRKDKQRGK